VLVTLSLQMDPLQILAGLVMSPTSTESRYHEVGWLKFQVDLFAKITEAKVVSVDSDTKFKVEI
jgi:hypothetical protein